MQLLVERKNSVDTLLAEGANPNYSNFDGVTVLQIAVRENNLEIAKLLLKKGADPNLADFGEYEEPPLAIACLNGNEDMAFLLIQHKADIEYCDEFGNFLIHWVASRGCVALTKFLLQRNPYNLEATDMNGNTPLHVACQNHKGKIIEILLNAGANMTALNKENKRPFELLEPSASKSTFDAEDNFAKCELQ